MLRHILEEYDSRKLLLESYCIDANASEFDLAIVVLHILILDYFKDSEILLSVHLQKIIIQIVRFLNNLFN